MFLLSAFDGGEVNEGRFTLFENFVVEAVVGGGIDGFTKISGVALHFVENDVFAVWTLDIRKGL